MEERHLKPYPWSEESGLAPGTLTAFLDKRSRSLKHSTLEKLAKKAGVTVTELLGPVASKADPDQAELLARLVAAIERQNVVAERQNELLERQLRLLERPTKRKAG